jgi:hypothetical protein
VVTDPQLAHDDEPGSEQVAPADLPDHEDGEGRARWPEPDPQLAHENVAATEQVAPPDLPDHDESQARVPAPETGRYVDNGFADQADDAEPRATLLNAEELSSVLSRWREVQARFVDEPRSAVQDADALVADLVQRLARMFAAERDQLESRWAGGADASTEDLRQGLLRYRSFFERLLAA